MINMKLFYKLLMSRDENKLKERIISDLKKSNKSFIENNLNFFFDFLAEHELYTSCVCNADKEETSVYLKKLLNCFKIEVNNDDEVIQSILDNTEYYIKRISEWSISEIPIINDTNKILSLKCYQAEFDSTNNWGHSSYSYTFKIICHENKVVWTQTKHEAAPEYFILKNDKLYGLGNDGKYEQYGFRKIYLFKDLDITYKDVDFNVKKLQEIKYVYIYRKSEFSIDVINMTEYFGKRFFYRGLLWDINWKGPINKVSNIEFSDDYLKIQITNLTYPHSGYVLLDIEKGEIIEAKLPMRKGEE